MKIFIAGCARSGTTLTRNLMERFADTQVFRHEAPVARFGDMYGPATTKVVKRTAFCWRYLPLLPSDVELLYCVRHPFDVLTSTHKWSAELRRFHVDQDRWTAEYDAIGELRRQQPARNIFFLRYEDTVADPDGQQRRIADFFNLTPARPFSGHAISVASVAKWQRDPTLRDFLADLPTEFMRAIEGFCREFGYEADLGTSPAHRDESGRP